MFCAYWHSDEKYRSVLWKMHIELTSLDQDFTYILSFYIHCSFGMKF